MFICEKYKKRKGKGNNKYVQHQLIDAIRTPAGPRHQIVLNLGRLSLPKEKWKTLANTIEGQLTNQRNLFPQDPEIEAKAKYYVRKIRQGRLSRAKECIPNNEATDKEEARYERVDVNSQTTSDVKLVGAEHVVISQMDEYGFDKILRNRGFTESQIIYSKMLII